MPPDVARCRPRGLEKVCSLAQLLLDPHYRTLEGLAVLVEKDWLSFGHKFAERTAAHSSTSPPKNNAERSPIFVQWLECVAHVIRQAPRCFEFTEAFLVFVADALHSGLFGNFLGNSDYERKMKLNVKGRTVSVWSHVLQQARSSQPDRFRNPLFRPYEGAIWPSVTLRDFGLWRRYYLRHSPSSHPSPLSEESWVDDLI